MNPNIDKAYLLRRHSLIKPYIHNTPVLTSTYFNELADCEIYFKCENFQKMGAFKMRGAANAMSSLSEEQKAKGVVTHSSGNFAQAVALSASRMGVTAYIVMPENAPQVKKEAVKGYGGIVIECESTAIARERTAEEIRMEKDATFLHPSNDLDVIIGQGTAAIELLEEYPDLDYILTPVGGGGLIAGTCLVCHHFSDHAKAIGVEPENVDDAYRSLQAGKIMLNHNDESSTIADGLRTFLGDVNFPIIQEYIDQILLVSESEIVSTLRDVYERMKIIIEPSCAVPLAGLIRNKSMFVGKKVGVVLSGGNVDVTKLPF
jgi:threonine dehydratase